MDSCPGDLIPIRTDLFEYISKEEMGNYTLKCLYETSCSAVVCRCNGEGVKYLLIRNKRSQYWGWPKGHMERGRE
ncbi:MAG: hypothetical protein LUG95_04060 [Clostridiales bacterium]|nr:hypothetical protein [Clostridiales bacterium]